MSRWLPKTYRGTWYPYSFGGKGSLQTVRSDHVLLSWGLKSTRTEFVNLMTRNHSQFQRVVCPALIISAPQGLWPIRESILRISSNACVSSLNSLNDAQAEELLNKVEICGAVQKQDDFSVA